MHVRELPIRTLREQSSSVTSPFTLWMVLFATHREEEDEMPGLAIKSVAALGPPRAEGAYLVHYGLIHNWHEAAATVDFGGDVIFAVMQAHPKVRMSEVTAENPYLLGFDGEDAVSPDLAHQVNNHARHRAWRADAPPVRIADADLRRDLTGDRTNRRRQTWPSRRDCW